MNFSSVLILPLLILLLLYPGCSNSLDPAYENGPSVVISFSLEESSHVKMWIENAYGTNVRTLLDREMQAGVHGIVFDMTDMDGNRLPQGLYTYHLKTDMYYVIRAVVIE